MPEPQCLFAGLGCGSACASVLAAICACAFVNSVVHVSKCVRAFASVAQTVFVSVTFSEFETLSAVHRNWLCLCHTFRSCLQICLCRWLRPCQRLCPCLSMLLCLRLGLFLCFWTWTSVCDCACASVTVGDFACIVWLPGCTVSASVSNPSSLTVPLLAAVSSLGLGLRLREPLFENLRIFSLF